MGHLSAASQQHESGHQRRRARRLVCFWLGLVALLPLSLDAAGVPAPQGPVVVADPTPPSQRRERRMPATPPPPAAQVLWVYLADKGAVAARLSRPQTLVSARSLRRRAKVRPPTALVDAADLPLDPASVSQVRARVTRVRQRSKWLNALSVEATAAEARAVAALPCVRRLAPVRRARRRAEPAPNLGETRPPAKAAGGAALTTLDYGGAYGQLSMLGVPTLHALGISGQGVLIGHFDNGYRLLAHAALATLQVVAAHDFVDGDADPAPPAGAPITFGAHGIVTLAVLAGDAPGALIGAAYGAAYVLARTEDDASETPVEEDNWIAAIEWADSVGIDVASTSLGYLDYDAPYPSWTWADMDGNTTAITRAADLAAARGIVVVNSAGNEGFDAAHNTLIAPADGDSVIAVAAVDAVGARAGFSSVGPTTDAPPRFKPDLAAQGVQVWSASAYDVMGYGPAGGTSLSCPLVAGVVALLLAAVPAATPMDIRTALQQTASQAGAPDNLLGWGIVDAVAALDWLRTTDAASVSPAVFRLDPNVPNPFNPATRIVYALPVAAQVRLCIYDAAGRRVRTLVDATQPAATHGVLWNGTDDAGRAVAAGVYLCRVDARADAGAVFTGVRKMVLLP